jgi:hypothetical protein
MPTTWMIYLFFLTSAAQAFGKFKDSFLAELHAEILSHAKQEATGVTPQRIDGITVHDSEVLEPEPVRQGGLMRKDMVCCSYSSIFNTVLTWTVSTTHSDNL